VSKRFKIFLVLSGMFLFLILNFNAGYYYGYKHGNVNGKLVGVIDCLIHMNKLAETLTEDKQ
jgi:hypothetical protein